MICKKGDKKINLVEKKSIEIKLLFYTIPLRLRVDKPPFRFWLAFRLPLNFRNENLRLTDTLKYLISRLYVTDIALYPPGQLNVMKTKFVSMQERILDCCATQHWISMNKHNRSSWVCANKEANYEKEGVRERNMRHFEMIQKRRR